TPAAEAAIGVVEQFGGHRVTSRMRIPARPWALNKPSSEFRGGYAPTSGCWQHVERSGDVEIAA
ncbi:MAG: hypothetical protein ACJ75Z_02290, partial [Solirubrobacterales bacterium]